MGKGVGSDVEVQITQDITCARRATGITVKKAARVWIEYLRESTKPSSAIIRSWARRRSRPPLLITGEQPLATQATQAGLLLDVPT